MLDRIAKSTYVKGVRGIRAILKSIGLLKKLDKATSRRGIWIRSLLAIYDLDDMERVGLPWWTFDAIDAVSGHLGTESTKHVFEWGSGASTLWLAKRSASVISIEFDPDWHAALSQKLSQATHVDLRLVPASEDGEIPSGKSGFSGQYFDDFVDAISQTKQKFDVIVIDARAREACLDRAVEYLSEDGIIVFDDTKRDRYKRAIAQSNLQHRRFDGMAVSLPLADSTTILAKSETVLNVF